MGASPRLGTYRNFLSLFLLLCILYLSPEESVETLSACEVTVLSSTSYGCDRGGRYCGMFSASNIFSLGDDKIVNNKANFWLAETMKGPGQGFVLDLGCSKKVHGVKLKNAQNRQYKNMGTKKFRLLGSTSASGPWVKIRDVDLEDSRQQTPPPIKRLMFADPVVISFLKFELLEFWGKGGGLQHFQILSGKSYASTIDFFEHAMSFSNHSILVHCCHADKIVKIANCGQGASCAGSCLALGATLCPSGDCAGDCRLHFGEEDSYNEEHRRAGWFLFLIWGKLALSCCLISWRHIFISGNSPATTRSAAWSWCPRARCPVQKKEGCCYNPVCHKKKPDECAWKDFIQGVAYKTYVEYIYVCPPKLIFITTRLSIMFLFKWTSPLRLP